MGLLMFWSILCGVCLCVGLLAKLRADQAKYPPRLRGRCPWSKPLLEEEDCDEDKEDDLNNSSTKIANRNESVKVTHDRILEDGYI